MRRMEDRWVGLVNWPESKEGAARGGGPGQREQGAADSFLPEEVVHRGLVQV